DEYPVWLWETAPSFLPTRLQALRTPPPELVESDYRTLQPGSFYPGSAVVLFVVDLPQPRQLGVVPAGKALQQRLKLTSRLGKETLGMLALGPDPQAIAELARQAVTTYVVPIRLRQGHRAAMESAFKGHAYYDLDDYLKPIRKDPELESF